MQIDPRFLLNPVEIVLARSRSFVLLLRQMSQKPEKKSGIECSRSESFLQKEDGVLLVYWLMRSESTLISENLTTPME